MRELAMALGAPCPWRWRRSAEPGLDQEFGAAPESSNLVFEPADPRHEPPVQANPACGPWLARPVQEKRTRSAPPQQLGRNCPRGILSVIIPTRGPRMVHP